MGFGTLFFGYFLLLNITYYGFSDLLSALIMAMGLYKLSEVNSQFKSAFYISISFSVIGLVEFASSFILMFFPTSKAIMVLEYTTLPRCVIIALLSLFILQGIKQVASEVKLHDLASRARMSMLPTLIIYGIFAILEIPIEISNTTLTGVLSIISAITLTAVLIIVTVNLITIYRAYMKICMPEDVENEVEEKPSKFEFINKHREHTQQKQREYAEYKLEKLKKKNTKKKKK